jgi:hypothetical protein
MRKVHDCAPKSFDSSRWHEHSSDFSARYPLRRTIRQVLVERTPKAFTGYARNDDVKLDYEDLALTG